MGGLLLVLLVVAGLVPNTGAIPASTSCPYGNCSTPSNTTVPTWLYGLLGALVVLALVLGLLLYRRRSPPSGGGAAASEAAVPPSAALGGPSGPEAPPVAGPPVAAPAAAYLETPEDVGQQPAAPAAVPPASEGGGEEDIDSLMKELDKISGEILKRGPQAKRPPTPPTGEGPNDPA